MKNYVKPSVEVVKLRPEEGIACFGSSNDSGGGQSDWTYFWFLCNW